MAIQIFFILLITGMVLFGAEIFVPGGILGIMGAACLVLAIPAAFLAFPGYGGIITLGMVIMLGVSLGLWMTLFPRSRLGRRMTVANSLAGAKSADATLAQLIGQEGLSASALRPGGFAVIGGRRVDVITTGEMIEKNTPIKVIEVEGSRVVVTTAAT